MALWGIQLEDNYTFRQVYDEFIECYHLGTHPSRITKYLVSLHSAEIDDIFDAHPFWFAIALGQWMTGTVEPAIYSKVRDIILGKKDMDIWQYQDPDIRKKRRIALQAFFTKIGKKNTQPLRRASQKETVRFVDRLTLRSPDNKKTLKVYETRTSNGRITTRASVSWDCRNFNVFECRNEVPKLTAHWEDSENLVICHHPSAKFVEQPRKTGSCVDKVKIRYEVAKVFGHSATEKKGAPMSASVYKL